MTIYDISNPSNDITIESEDVRVAQAATLLLGQGLCGLSDEREVSVLPMFILGGVRDWIEKHFPESLNVFIGGHRTEIATCLESVLYCSVADRKALVASLREDTSKGAFARFNEAKRTGPIDYCLSARTIAKSLRKTLRDTSDNREKVDTNTATRMAMFLGASDALAMTVGRIKARPEGLP